MRAIVQKVKKASVKVSDELISEIGDWQDRKSVV